MTLLEALRTRTRDAHEALHVHPLLAPLTRPDLTSDQYRDAIQAFDAVYRAMEAGRTITHDQAWPNDASTADACPDAPVTQWLAADMARLGAAPLDLNIDAPPIDSPARLLGYLYVKQGSTLGGAVMSKNLNRALGLKPQTDQRFFAGYGTETGANWKLFIEFLFRKAPNFTENDIVEMAVASFQAIAVTCDAVHMLKARNALQTPPGTLRKAAQAGA